MSCDVKTNRDLYDEDCDNRQKKIKGKGWLARRSTKKMEEHRVQSSKVGLSSQLLLG